MADLPTRADLFRIARNEALHRSQGLTIAEIDRPGSDLNILLAAGVAVGEELVGQLALARAAQNYSTAKKEQLRRLVYDRTTGQVVPKAASPAITSVNFATMSGAGVDVTIPQGTTLQTAGGQQFITTAAVSLIAGTHGPLAAPVRSVLAGASQQVPTGQINAITSQIVNAPADLSVSNSLASFGADDEEGDTQLVIRARQFFVNARRGTLGAIVSGALSVAGVRAASAFEVVDPHGNPARAVHLVVTDAYTDALASLTAPPASYAAQSAAVAAQIQDALSEYRAGGIPVPVFVAQVILIQINLALSFSTTADLVAAPAAAVAAVVSYVNALSPGATLAIAGLVRALRAVPGLVLTGDGSAAIASPQGDVLPTQLQVFRTTTALVKVVS